MTKKELLKKLKLLDLKDGGQIKHIVCTLIGHSNIETICIGYHYCGRCGNQVGDTLAGAYTNGKMVIINHNCPTCRENYKKMGWRDKFMVPDPFKKAD